MGEFLQTLFVGLRLGSVYALIALGYTMVYGIIRLINFAHGDFIMVGGYTLFFTVPLMTAAGLPAWAAVVIAMAVCALVGVGVELVAYRPVRKKGTNMTALITMPLDGECYMFGKCWTGAYCLYFREAVLPLAPALESALLTEGPRPDFKPCPVCGSPVPPDRRQAYCSAACAKKAHRRQQREYMRKKRGWSVDN